MLSHIKDASVRFISQIGLPTTFNICLAVVVASMFTGLVAYQLEQSGQFRAKRAELLHSFARTAEGLQMRTSPLTASTLEAGAISEESREGLRESIRQQYVTSRDLEAYFDREMREKLAAYRLSLNHMETIIEDIDPDRIDEFAAAVKETLSTQDRILLLARW